MSRKDLNASKKSRRGSKIKLTSQPLKNLPALGWRNGIWRIVAGVLLTFSVTGCALLQEKIEEELRPDEPKQEQPVERTPVDPSTIPLAGEFVPDPVVVLYEFVFADSTRLVFRDMSVGDYWGAYPSAGWGQITWTDGRKEGIDVNSKIRVPWVMRGLEHRSLGTIPVTTPDHGGRMYWMADVEETPNAKRVTIFEDGWSPHVEIAVLEAKESIGITSPLVESRVKVEKRK